MRRLALGFILLALAPAALQGQQLTGPEVTEVRFEGNETFTGTALANAIVTRQTECRSVVLRPFCWANADWAVNRYYLRDRTLQQDIARIGLFYYQRGYREATADTVLERPAPDEVRITFRVTEGRPVRVDSLSIEGLGTLADSTDVASDLPLRQDDPLSGILLDATRDSLQNRLRNRGFAHVDVLRNYFIGREEPYSARVTFDVYTGPRTRVGPMTVVGNQAVSESVVRQMLPFQEGDPYEQDLVFEAQRNLYNLEIFRHAEIRSDLTYVPDSVIPLRIQVNEGNVHRVRAGAGMNNGDCLNSEVSWTSRNFFGGARRLQVRGGISNVFAPSLHDSVCTESGSGEFGRLNWSVSTDFTQPWIFSPRNSLTASLYGERQSLKDVFVREAVGLSLSLSRNVGRRQTVTFVYAPQLASLSAAEIFFCTSFLVCEQEDIGLLSGTNWLSPVSVGYTQDRTNQLLNPTDGYSFQLEAEHASQYTASNFRYHRLVGEVNRYLPIVPGWVAAMHLRVGWMDPYGFSETFGADGDLQVAHPQVRFFAGGSNSVRGYAQNQLGPRNLSVPVQTLLGNTVGDEEGGTPVCTPGEVLDLTCDPERLTDMNGALRDGFFTPRPTGGSQLLEGSVEVRFPLGPSRMEGAMFFDFGQVWSEVSSVDLGDIRLSPGIGFRYLTPIGPLRVDLGYQLRSGADLQVVTSRIRPYDPAADPQFPGRDPRLLDPDGNRLDYVETDDLALLGPRVLFDDVGPWSLRRFQLHLSLGQAF